MDNMNQIHEFDERDTLFARLRLVAATSDYDEYYGRHPELKERDDALRDRGGLMRLIAGGGLSVEEIRALGLQPDEASKILEHLSDDALVQALMDDSTATISDYVRADLRRRPARRRIELPPDRMGAIIRDVTRLYGASLVGITDMKDRDYYTHRRSGETVDLRFRHAIVFAVEMSKDLVNHAPSRETFLATCNGYVDAARVGARLSGFVKSLGYETSLNSMARYDAPLVPLAEKAGLGQRGRCHFIVTKEFGNRVRLGAVLTDLPVDLDEPADFGLIEFCALCGECAVHCPGKALSGAPQIVNDRPVWQFDEMKCFHMWTEYATDCGICIASCPLSQGIDPEQVAAMRNQPDLMWNILREDRERQREARRSDTG
jgi:ferredoxin